MEKTIQLTESELKRIVRETISEYQKETRKVLQETMHYPAFLDVFKFDIAEKIIDALKSGNHTETFEITVGSNQYIHEITVIPKAKRAEDIDNQYLYGAGYDSVNTVFRDGKLRNGIIYLYFPENTNGETNYSIIQDCVFHELNHVYDDYTKRTNNDKYGKSPLAIGYDKAVQDANAVVTDVYLSDFGILAYYNCYTETNAFLSTVPMELERVNADRQNIQITSRETSTYKEIHDHFRLAVKSLNYNGGMPNDFLFFLNNRVKDMYPNAGIPFFKTDFAPSEYREKLLTWAEKSYKRFIKKYYKVAQYYLDTHKETIEEKNAERRNLIDGCWRYLGDTFGARNRLRFDQRIGLVENQFWCFLKKNLLF